jgi:hypothetical protein
MTQKNIKRLINFIFCSAGCSLWRAEGFFCSLDVLYGGLELSELQYFFFFNFWSPKPWIRVGIRIHVKCWTGFLYYDPDSMNTDHNKGITT